MATRRVVQLFIVIIIVLCVSLYIDQSRHWVFDPETLQQLAQQGIDEATRKSRAENLSLPNSTLVIDEVIRRVQTRYPGVTRYSGRWLWNNAGGAMGSMTVLHCSLSEYLIIFGSNVGTEGHSGRFLAEDFFTILHGEQWASLPGVSAKEVYTPGMQHYLPRHTAKQYRFPDECWALEYARGNIPSMMIFGFMDSLFSTVDFVTIFHTVFESSVNMFHNVIKGKI